MRVERDTESECGAELHIYLYVHQCLWLWPCESLNLSRISLQTRVALHLPDAGEARADGEEPHGAPAPPPHKVRSVCLDDLLMYRSIDRRSINNVGSLIVVVQ
jgi:hypothetical protein